MTRDNFEFPHYFPLDTSLVHRFESVPAIDSQALVAIEKSIREIVEATNEYAKFVLDKERAGQTHIDEKLLQNHVQALAGLLKSKHSLTIFADSVKTSRIKIRQELRHEQPLSLETLEHHQQNSGAKQNVADVVLTDYKDAVTLADVLDSFSSILRSLKEYQYVKNVAFVLAHPEDVLPDDSADDELAIAGGKVSLKDPISLQYFESPVISKKCRHVYEEANILARLGEGQNACPIDGCAAQVRRTDLEPDEIMKLRVKTSLAVQHRRQVDRI